jgi:formylglycine-generating enzyme required for sulfatase activity
MKNTTDHFDFSDQHFDMLLNHALLSTKQQFTSNEKTMETISQHIFSSANTAAISESKSNLVIEKLAHDFRKRNKFRLNNWLFVFLTAGVIAAILFFTLRDKRTQTSAAVTPAAKQEQVLPEPLPAITAQGLASNPMPVVNPSVVLLDDSAEVSEISQIVNGKAPEKNYIPTKMYIPENNFNPDDIPELSEAEKKATAKQKMLMMRNISKKKNYGSLPPGNVSVAGSMISVAGFSIQNTEVTNLEYRTFLNDLLAQGRIDDYLLAKPVSGGWKTIGIPKFENVYFENKKYNDFPAVNMSRRGAELYCEWLTTSMKEAIASKEVKWSGAKNPEFRLPSNAEWIYAARNADSTTVEYPWARVIPDSVNNHHGCFLCNFNYKASEGYFKNVNICPGFGKLKQGGFHQPIITSAGMAIDTLLTAPVYSYNPNEWGQYCMMGNVSEMVWTYQPDGAKGAARSLGGNWNSPVENVQIEAAEQYVGVTDASPMIGFRPLMNGYFNYAMMKQVRIR